MTSGVLASEVLASESAAGEGGSSGAPKPASADGESVWYLRERPITAVNCCA